MKQLTEDEFDAQFTVVLDAAGDSIRNSDEGLDRSSTKLWTIVDPGNGSLYALSGWHYVNRFGYIVTEEDWTEPTEGVWWPASEDDNEDNNDETSEDS
ncbi:MAG: hypothetical protein ABWX92_02870 [Mycetocola sp.]